MPGMLIPAAMPSDRAAALRAERLDPPFERLRALHTPKRPPRPGDWLAERHEDVQSPAEFARSLPLVPTAARRAIYLQPIGDFSDAQRRVVAVPQWRSFRLAVRVPPLPAPHAHDGGPRACAPVRHRPLHRLGVRDERQ